MSVQKPTGRKKNEMIHHKSEVRDSPCPVLYAMSILRRYGIYYIDPSPNNINCESHPLAVKTD